MQDASHRLTGVRWQQLEFSRTQYLFAAIYAGLFLRRPLFTILLSGLGLLNLTLKPGASNSRAKLMLLLLEALLQSGFSAIASRQQTNRVAHHNHLVVTQPCRVFQY